MRKIAGVRLSVLLLVYFSAAAAAAYAQPLRPPLKGKGPGGDEELLQLEQEKLQLFQYLKLTDEQKDKLEANRLKHSEEIYALQKEIRAKRNELRVALDKPQIEINVVKELHDALKFLYGKIEDIHLEGILSVHQILTSGQFSRFMEFNSRARPMHPPRQD